MKTESSHMGNEQFSKKPAYVESIRGLLALHELSLAGKDEGPEADPIRDRLSVLWRELTEAERRRLTGLSEDLYSISDPPPLARVADSKTQRRLIEAIEARCNGEWDRSLELLRQCAGCLTPDVLAYLRSSIWREAGDEATAAVFLENAARLDSSNGDDAAPQLLQESGPTRPGE